MYFSSKPVVNVEAHMSSQPMRTDTDEDLLMSELRVCFTIQEIENRGPSKYWVRRTVDGSETLTELCWNVCSKLKL